MSAANASEAGHTHADAHALARLHAERVDAPELILAGSTTVTGHSSPAMATVGKRARCSKESLLARRHVELSSSFGIGTKTRRTEVR
jgi:hypothetical protein